MIVSSFCLAVIILPVLVDWLCVYACLFCSPSRGAQQMQGLLISVKCRSRTLVSKCACILFKIQNIQNNICLYMYLNIKFCNLKFLTLNNTILQYCSWYDTKYFIIYHCDQWELSFLSKAHCTINNKMYNVYIKKYMCNLSQTSKIIA